ncbi:LuxR family transcriptional regulator [Allokutzneria sp. A3M-2-11 16]|uniref:helix-turn-helix transcriptional regulator n=1 Tax=Allokutzneria sp. A3M-2-11 16 TaxID=2962043 RepID=UPI0020B88401|nr:LuxR family transcriptional regulator [Allokutzneria sp. A3M-2-11 16]MCP3801421.1 LuxR family transcriptional regulator [Allokutzneria sp. A3M-2-11 16]
MTVGSHADWPLTGRSAELDSITAVLRRGERGGVLLTGEAGIGKSRLARAVFQRCRADGLLVVTATGAEATREMPFAAVAGWLPEGTKPSMRADFFGAATRRLRALANGRRIVLGLDDAHFLDDVSAALVQHLATTVDARPVATARAAAAERDPVAALRRRGLVEVFEVRPLSAVEVTDLLHGVLGGPVAGLTAELLCHNSQGNPLFLRHLIDSGLESGALAERDGVWCWNGPLTPHARLGDAVAAAIGTLTEADARAMEYLAHAEPVEADVLERLVPAAVLDGLEARSLLAVEPSGSHLLVRCAHPLYGEVTRARTGRLRRRRVFRRLAEAGATDQLRAVDWRLRGGLAVSDDQVLGAAREALTRCDPRLAEELARRIPSTAALSVLSQALVAQGKAEEAESLLCKETTGELVAIRAINLLWGLRRPDAAAEVVRAASERSPELGVAELAIDFFGSGRIRAVDRADLAPTTPVVAGAAATLSVYLRTFAGRPEQVVTEFGELGLSHVWASLRGAARACHLHALTLTGRIREALLTGERYYAEAVAEGDPAEVALIALERGVCESWSGRVPQALPYFREARALVTDAMPFPIQAYVASEFAACAAALREPSADVIAETRARMPSESGLSDHMAFAEIRVLANSGQSTHAATLLEALVRKHIGAGRLTNAVECQYYLCRMRPSIVDASLLAELATRCDSPAFPLFAAHAHALATRDVAALEASAVRLAELGYGGMALEAATVGADVAKGRSRTAARLGRMAERLSTECGFSPVWLNPLTGPQPLTTREREVCELAVAGLDNAGIASRLAVSVRTVGNHLQHAYAKLGVRRRTDLAAALNLP